LSTKSRQGQEWDTASDSSVLINSYKTTTYGYQVQKITSHLEINWNAIGINDAPLIGKVVYDYYSLWDDTYSWSKGGPENP
jgi:hypothetical protein